MCNATWTWDIYEGGYKDDYDPTHHSYTLPNTAGLVGAQVWFLGPEDAAAIYGVATPMRVAMWSVVAVSDQPGALVNQGSLAVAAGMAAALPRNEGPAGIGGVVAPQGIGADPWEAGSYVKTGISPIAEADTIPEGRRLQDWRFPQPGESAYRYETGHPNYTRVTPQRGLRPGTYAAPSSEPLLSQGQLATRYNLPSPDIPRTIRYNVSPGPLDVVVGPRPVAGGTGYEVYFPFGTGPDTVSGPYHVPE